MMMTRATSSLPFLLQRSTASTTRSILRVRRYSRQRPLLRSLQTTAPLRRRFLSTLNGFEEPQSRTQSSHHSDDDDAWIQGSALDLAADVRTLRPGDKLEIPYELTVSESMQDFWQSAFHAQDRIHTSRPFCRKMGLQDRVLPFELALFLTSSMTHADAAKIQVGFGNVHYLWPAFAGDTFTKNFTVSSIRNTSDGNHSVRTFPRNEARKKSREFKLKKLTFCYFGSPKLLLY